VTNAEGKIMDKILLRGMEFYGYHGVLEEERRLGQWFTVDLELVCDLRLAGTTDDLRDTVDYADVYEQVQEIVTGTPFQLVETLAEIIAARVMKNTLVKGVVVRVEKKQAPIKGHFQSVGVQVTRGERE
ncbi:MAG: dihydroneopterin aldolase, partial [Bacillota bacterium]